MTILRFEGELTEGVLLCRVNRFVAQVRTAQGEVVAHVPNSGRLAELLFPGNRVLLRTAEGPGRRTRYTVILARAGQVWACIVSAYANALAREAAVAGCLPELAEYGSWRPEVRWGGSRFDWWLSADDGRTCLVEVKGVTLVEDGDGLFPDAPTERGARHLRELAEAAAGGQAAALVFAVLMAGARRILPHRRRDPAFAEALAAAGRAGVRLLAFACEVSPVGIVPSRRLPVEWQGGDGAD